MRRARLIPELLVSIALLAGACSGPPAVEQRKAALYVVDAGTANCDPVAALGPTRPLAQMPFLPDNSGGSGGGGGSGGSAGAGPVGDGGVPAVRGGGHVVPIGRIPETPPGQAPDTVQQEVGMATSAASYVFGPAGNGLGSGFVGPAGWSFDYWAPYAPPDPNLAVGPSHIVQVVNAQLAVFDKGDPATKRQPTALYGPIIIERLWQETAPASICAQFNDGDPIVKYDVGKGRWLITQFVHSAPGNNRICVAVSTSSDPLGTWVTYEYKYDYDPDYLKLGVWPDGYYVTFNAFDAAGGFVGTFACAWDRDAMAAGAPARQICAKTLGYNLLPSDWDGADAPPAGTPNYLLSLNFADYKHLNLWAFKVDWNACSTSDVLSDSSYVAVPTSPYKPTCSGAGSCIPQLGGGKSRLDALSDRLMYRLAYRHRSGYGALVVNHSAMFGTGKTATGGGVRWYELRIPDGAAISGATVFQQGTFGDSSAFRWMGSAAMDRTGDIAVGYSMSSTKTYPSIRFAGRLPSDAAGTLGAEQTLKAGAGAQVGLDRWGDYTSLVLDPADDCRFWYTNQHQPANGSYNWRTWIASFRFTACH
jgi:hypothetical protein